MNFEAPLTLLVWVASMTSVLGTYLVSYLLHWKYPDRDRGPSTRFVVETRDHHHLRHARRGGHS